MSVLSIYSTGDWHPADSYGKLAIELAKHASARGVRVNCLGLGKTQVEAQSPEVQALTSQPILASLGGIALGWVSALQHLSTLFHVGPRVALTMFESTRMPPEWIAPLNEMDAVIVPSTFCESIFRECGVTARLEVVPLGVDDYLDYLERPSTFTEARPLTFLAIMDRGERKGGVVALQGFLRAFGDDPTKKLILKSRNVHWPVKFSFTNGNIETIQEDYDEAQMAALYARADVLINPHRGEGFGLVPREFAATGGLSLTTAWSGTTDQLDQWGEGLDFSLNTAGWGGNQHLEGREMGEWAIVNEDTLAATLTRVAAHWPLYHALARKRSRAVKALYSWANFGDRVLKIWEEVCYARADQKSAA